MNSKRHCIYQVLLGIVTVCAITSVGVAADATASSDKQSVDRQKFEQLIANWPERPRLGASAPRRRWQSMDSRRR
jgi:hypothetical protein